MRNSDAHLVADLERDLTGAHPGNLVTVAVPMETALGADGHGFLEQHDPLVGLVAEELQGGEAAGRSHVEMRSTARGYDKAFCCVHRDLSFPVAKFKGRPRMIARSSRHSYA
jgi:hypothetical protein